MLISLSADLNVFAFQHTTTTIDNKLLSSNEYIYLIQVLKLCGVFYTRSDHQTTHISSFIYHAIIEHIVLYKRRILSFYWRVCYVECNMWWFQTVVLFLFCVSVFFVAIFSYWNENVRILMVGVGKGNNSIFFVYLIMKMKRNRIDLEDSFIYGSFYIRVIRM